MNILKRLLVGLGVLTLFIVPVAATSTAHAVGSGFVTCGSEVEFPDPTQEEATCEGEAGSEQELTDVIQTIVDVISIIVGIAAVLVIMIAGLRMITSNGDAGAIASARSSVIYAIVGLIVVAFAQAIVRFASGVINGGEG